MVNLSNAGRAFYGIAMTATGMGTIFFNSYPYILLPPFQYLTPGPAWLHILAGVIFILAGVCIVLKKKISLVSFLFGSLLLLIFCFLHVPYQLMVNPNYLQLGQWENAEKELCLAGGAYIIAACFSENNENPFNRFCKKLMRFGAVLFAVPIFSWGILHFQFAKDVSTLVPSWIPFHLFWTYMAGIGLLGSGIAIILNIKTRIIATLLGIIILIWFITIHVPGVITASYSEMGDQITSASLALAYSGIAFIIAGPAKKNVRTGVG